MKNMRILAGVLLGCVSVLGACEKEVQRVSVLPPSDPNAYERVPMPKPMPPEGYTPGLPNGGMPDPNAPAVLPGSGGAAVPSPSIKNEEAFVRAYEARRNPRMMVFVNRTIQGDPLPKDGLEELYRIEKNVTATGRVSTKDSEGKWNTKDESGTVTSRTLVKLPADKTDVFGATSSDYEMIEAALVQYFDNSGKVQIQDSEAARSKLDREKILRIENGDPAAAALLGTELQQDVLIRLTAKPTTHASWGNAVRLISKATSTTDGRNLGTAFVDMPLPISKTNVQLYGRYLTEVLMGEMVKKWSNPENDMLEVRVYKLGSVDDGILIKKMFQKTVGVTRVVNRGMTGSGKTAYAVIAVAFAGAPEDLYAAVKEDIKLSKGVKAVDLQNNTVTLEVIGAVELKINTVVFNSETKKDEFKIVQLTLGKDPGDEKISGEKGIGIPAGYAISPTGLPTANTMDLMKPVLPK